MKIKQQLIKVNLYTILFIILKLKLLYDRNNGYKIDTISREQKIYNENKELIKLILNGKPFINYSKFTANKLPQIEEWIFEPKNRKEYKYDSNDDLIEQKEFQNYNNSSTNKETDSIQVETITYKYDNHHNVIELKRSFKFPVEFPIIIGGGKSHYEHERFRYAYNKYGLWTKKYWIIKDKEILIEKRRFYKN